MMIPDIQKSNYKFDYNIHLTSRTFIIGGNLNIMGGHYLRTFNPPISLYHWLEVNKSSGGMGGFFFSMGGGGDLQ